MLLERAKAKKKRSAGEGENEPFVPLSARDAKLATPRSLGLKDRVTSLSEREEVKRLEGITLPREEQAGREERTSTGRQDRQPDSSVKNLAYDDVTRAAHRELRGARGWQSCRRGSWGRQAKVGLVSPFASSDNSQQSAS